MTVKLVLVTHENVGESLLHAVKKTYDTLPLPTTVIKVGYDSDIDKLKTKITKLIETLAQSEGVLILTDLYGATPSNLTSHLQAVHKNVKIISGLNLPMLMRVMNYPSLGLEQLASTAVEGGKEGIVEYSPNKDQP